MALLTVSKESAFTKAWSLCQNIYVKLISKLSFKNKSVYRISHSYCIFGLFCFCQEEEPREELSFEITERLVRRPEDMLQHAQDNIVAYKDKMLRMFEVGLLSFFSFLFNYAFFKFLLCKCFRFYHFKWCYVYVRQICLKLVYSKQFWLPRTTFMPPLF